MSASQSSPHFWVGRMSAVLGESARMIDNHDHGAAKRFLRETLASFIASDCPAEETRRMLRPYLGGKR